MTSPAAPAPKDLLVPAAIIDLIAVVVFVATGRASHDEAFSIAGFSHSLWPFVVGAAAGWALTYLLARVRAARAAAGPGTDAAQPRSGWQPARPFPEGGIIWVSTVAVGMTLRAASGQGTALAFVIVATVSTAILLLGWRSLVLLTARRRG